MLQNLLTANGCDSIHQVTVVFKDNIATTEMQEYCDGETPTILGIPLMQDTVLTQNLLSVNGCDSILEIYVLFTPEIETQLTDTLCAGEYFLFLGDTISQSGVYSQTLASLSDNCDTNYVLTIYTHPEINYNLPATINAYASEPFELPLAVNNTSLQYSWFPKTGLSCYDCQLPMATLTENQSYTAMITSPSGCTDIAHVDILVEERTSVYIPNVFSSNDDQQNDYFGVFSNVEIEIITLQVYNRWGALIFEQKDTPINNPMAGWDGTFKGNPVEPGVYVYKILLRQEDGTVEMKVGDIGLVW